MAKTSNYQWDLPNPIGIQIAEMQKVADSIIAIDAKLKASETALSTHKHTFAEITEKPTTLEGYGITDGMTAAEIAAAIKAAIDGLVNGSGAALDTLKELADALGNDPEFATTVGNALGVRVRVDAAQSFSLAQKAQGRGNLDALGTVDKGKENGVASLDGTGKVPATQLPAMNYLPLTGGTLTGELRVATQNGLRIIASGTSAFFRYDGTDVYLMFSDTETGQWNSLRPIRVNAATGLVTFGHEAAVGSNIYMGASGQIAPDGNIKGTRWGGNWLYDYLHAPGTLLGSAAYPRRSDGAKIVFNWSGQAGQPTWIWGGNDGVNMYVYNPANWSVNYANSAGTAGNVGGWTAQAFYDRIEDRSFWRTRDYLLAENIPVGGYIFAQCVTGGGLGDVRGGNQLFYAHGNGSAMSGVVNVGFGTWWASGAFSGASSSQQPNATTLWKRIG